MMLYRFTLDNLLGYIFCVSFQHPALDHMDVTDDILFLKPSLDSISSLVFVRHIRYNQWIASTSLILTKPHREYLSLCLKEILCCISPVSEQVHKLIMTHGIPLCF